MYENSNNNRAGLAGLSCAIELKNDFEVRIHEAKDKVGGRIQTYKINGFLLDRGFAVLLESYPNAMKLLNYNDLKLKRFAPGTTVRINKKLYYVHNPF
ncbi:MAG: FAD-dependent oxidoreductase [Candidatus Hodarchaeales archaeon]